MLYQELKGVCSLVCLSAFFVLLVGCAGDHSDLEQFVKDVKARKGEHIPPLPEFKTYDVFSYPGGVRDPFEPIKQQEIMASFDEQQSGPKPDLNRHKEALEAYPLDSLRYIGLLERNAEKWAIISASDNMVYRTQTGDHLGQNFGEIIEINEGSVELVELVPNGLGGWVERNASLNLVE